MKKRSLKKFSLKKYKPYKDDEGNVIPRYEEDISSDEAIIWPANSKVQIELYGARINSIMNMHYYGLLNIKELDCIHFEGIQYKVISVKKYRRFKVLEIERL